MQIVMGWPEWVVVVVWAIKIAIWGLYHGKHPTWTYNVGGKIIGVAISAYVLYAGGLFS